MTIDGYQVPMIVHDVVTHILFYPYGALWYILACVVGSLILIPFIKKNKINIALVVGFALYVFALLCNNYYGVAEFLNINNTVDAYLDIFISARNGLFVGFFMLALGMKCSQIYEKITNWIFPILGLGLLIYLIEIFFIINYMKVADDGALFISHIFISPCLLLSVVKLKWSIPYNITKKMRDLSVGMYLLHRPILWYVAFFTNNPFFLFVFTTLISITLCLIVYKFKIPFLNKVLR